MGRQKAEVVEDLRNRFAFTPTKRRPPVADGAPRVKRIRTSGRTPSPEQGKAVILTTADQQKSLPVQVRAPRSTKAKALQKKNRKAPATFDDNDPLNDILRPDLDLVFVGINPGTHSARHRRHYAGPNNMFCMLGFPRPLLYESGLVTEPLSYSEDERVLEWGIGLTNIVQRPSPSSQDLHKKEITDGAATLKARLLRVKPRLVCFNGKGIYEVFAGNKSCSLGLQDATLPGTDTPIYVMPSTSGRTSAYPTRASKLPFFVELRELVSKLRQDG